MVLRLMFNSCVMVFGGRGACFKMFQVKRFGSGNMVQAQFRLRGLIRFQNSCTFSGLGFRV